jgi:cation transport regulator ChaB
MPWSTGDVDKFKKGLSDEQKKKWVTTANSVLSDCMKKGGSEKECAGKAVRIANGVTGHEALGDWQNYESFEPPESGDAPQEIKNILKSAYTSCRTSWVEDHPEDKENANNKTKCSKIAWGAVRKAGWSKSSDGKWSKTTSNNEGYIIHKSIQEPNYTVTTRKHQGKEHLVVPVVMMVEGVHYGSHGPLYHSINELGRYPESWNGIPVVVNHPEIDGISVSANYPDIIDEQTIGRVYNTFIDGNRLKAEAWIDSEKLQQLSATMLDQLKKGELIEVSIGVFSDEEVVAGDWNGEHYEAIARNHRPDHLALLPGGVGACSIADGCGIRVNSEGVPSTESPEIELVNINKEEVHVMAEEAKCTPCVQKKVNDLLANEHGKFIEEDREWLESLSEVQLDKLTPTVLEVEKIVEVNVLSEEDKAIIAGYKRQKEEARNVMVQTIQTNLGKDTWTDEVLSGMKDDVLEKVVGLINKKPEPIVDYSLSGAEGVQSKSAITEEPLAPTGIKFKKQ